MKFLDFEYVMMIVVAIASVVLLWFLFWFIGRMYHLIYKPRRDCFHHTKNLDTGSTVSWIGSQLINGGAGKMFWCTQCGKTWTV